MNNFDDLEKATRQARAQDNAALVLKGVSFQLYDGELLQFNATLEGQQIPTIKFEERTPEKSVVAVAPEDGGSINYAQAKTFAMDEPLDHLAAAFPNSVYIQRLFVCLINAR